MLLYTLFQNHVCCPTTIFIINNTAYSDWCRLWQTHTATTDRSYIHVHDIVALQESLVSSCMADIWYPPSVIMLIHRRTAVSPGGVLCSVHAVQSVLKIVFAANPVFSPYLGEGVTPPSKNLQAGSTSETECTRQKTEKIMHTLFIVPSPKFFQLWGP